MPLFIDPFLSLGTCFGSSLWMAPVALSFDVLLEVRFIFDEIRVVKARVLHVGQPYLVEVVHVELAYKRLQVGVVEVQRQDDLPQLLFVFDHEAIFGFVPTEYMVVFRLLKNITQLQ